MSIFERTSFRCLISGHFFENYANGSCNDADKDYPERKMCVRCRYVKVKGEHGDWHDEESKAGRMVIRRQAEKQRKELNERVREASDRLEAATIKLMRRKAEQLANLDMLNADPAKIFNRNLSVKNHYETLMEKEQRNEVVRLLHERQIMQRTIAACNRL
jgi:hypothetical protein